MKDQSHRKADPVPVKAERTYTPVAEQAQPDKATTTREKANKADAQQTEE